MAWNDQSGDGPWGRKSGGPWGGGGQRGSGGGGGGNVNIDLDELLKRLKGLFPGGGGGIRLTLVLAGGAVLLWLASGFYTVQTDEEGVELVFGKLYEVTAPGLNYNFPAPIGEVLKPKVTTINRVDIGFRAPIREGAGAVTRAVPEEGLMLTGDENIIDIKFSVLWRIKDARSYLFNIRAREESVKYAAEAAMRELVGKNGFEYIRTDGRALLATQIRDLLQEIIDSYGAGIEIVGVNLQAADPPEQVFGAFRDVQAARADKERTINEATAYANEIAERAQGQSEQIIQAAQAYREERISQAEGDAQRFLSVYTEYAAAKDITRRRIFLSTMEEILEKMDKILIEGQDGGQGILPYLPLDRLVPERSGRTQGDQ